jgi:hypothetical protein
MAVHVHRYRDRRVSKPFLHHLRMDALREQKRRRAMAQIVEADLGQPGAFEQGAKGAPGEVPLHGWRAPSSRAYSSRSTRPLTSELCAMSTT